MIQSYVSETRYLLFHKFMLGIWVEKMIKCAMFYICLGVVKFDRLM